MMTVSDAQTERPGDQGIIQNSGAILSGVIVVRQDLFGFIKSPDVESRVYFSSKDCDSTCRSGTRVQFTLAIDPKSKKTVAKHVRGLGTPVSKKGEEREEVDIPGTFTGVIQALPKASADVHVDDGMISFIYHDGCQHQAMFGNWRVAGGGVLSLGQPVEFRVALNPITKVYKALDVQVDQTVVEALGTIDISRGEEKQVPQMGKVVLLKKEFGFIKRLGHAGDLFFHFSEIDDKEDTLKVGDDVSFIVRHDSDGRQCACNITRAPAGSVQFEVMSKEYYHGVVMEKPAVSKSYEKLPGVIDFVEQPLRGSCIGKKEWINVPKTKLLFYANENEGVQSLRSGDHIIFKIITDVNALTAAKLAGKDTFADLIARRAAQMQPIRGTGTIVDMKDHKKGSNGYGFLTWNGSFLDTVEVSTSGKSPQHRLFFQRTDLQQSETFNIGDTVYFTLHSHKNTDDMAATRIRMKEKASSKVAEGRIPLKLQQRRLQAQQPNKSTAPTAMPKVPDGTRGFSMIRASYVREKELAEDDLLGLCCGFRLKGIFPEMTPSLSAEALPFNPMSAS